MPNPDIKALIQRIEREGASRENECSLAVTADGFFVSGEDGWGRPKYARRDPETGGVIEPGQAHDMLVPRYLHSLDAALAFVERAAPNLSVENLGEMSPDCGPLAGHWLAQLRPRVPRPRMTGAITPENLLSVLDGFEPVSAPTPALALILATLHALAAEAHPS